MPASRHTITSLDGLRALAILLVIGCHLNTLGQSQPLSPGPLLLQDFLGFGFAGVFLFFPLSGFLLFLPYARAMLSDQPWPSARTFYLRRALRILPAYYVVLILLACLSAPLLISTHALPQLYLVSVLLADMRPDAFNLVVRLNTPFWTLGIETQFYVLLPWLAWLLAKGAGRSTSRKFLLRLGASFLSLLLLLLFIRLIATLLHYQWGYADPITFPGPGGVLLKVLYGVKGKYLESFLLGMMMSLVYVWGIERQRLSRSARSVISPLALALALAGLVACGIWAASIQRIPVAAVQDWIFPPTSPVWSVLGEWSLSFCFSLLLLAVLLGGPVVSWLFSYMPLRFIGIISYSLYVWHYPLLSWLAPHFTSYPLFILVGLALLFLVGSASYLIVERPFLRWRRTVQAPPGSHAPYARLEGREHA